MATNQTEKTLELKVGAFVFLGLAVLAGLVIQFGRVGEGFKTYYGLTIRFPDASGLLKGSDVLLAGAKIGRVSEGPRLARSGQGVEVPLRIYDYIKIPAESKFSVGSSGLLGDRFVAVTMPPGEPPPSSPRIRRSTARAKPVSMISPGKAAWSWATCGPRSRMSTPPSAA